MNATSGEQRIPLEKANLIADPKAYADGRILDVYRWLRNNQPLAVAAPDGFDPFWVVTRRADVVEASRRNSDFLNGQRSSTLTTQAADQAARARPRVLRTLINMDAPEHPKSRQLIQNWFMPPNLKRVEAQIRQIARQMVDRLLAADGECDFVNQVALHYPLLVIMSIIGMPESDEPLMLKLTQQVLGSSDPELSREGQAEFKKHQANPAAVAEFLSYFKRLSDSRRARPEEDLATVIAHAQIDGQPISDVDAMGLYMIVATAGHDTTSSSIGGTLWALASHQDELRKVKADPSLIPSLVDEGIRWITPVKDFMRTAASDTTLAGHNIRQGDWLMLCYASANRDESAFEEPDVFRVDRPTNRHVAFGYGGHVCLGQHLAKMETRILFEELLPRLHSVELAGQPAFIESYFISGPKRLPIRYAMT
jgi:cytochrome P450